MRQAQGVVGWAKEGRRANRSGREKGESSEGAILSTSVRFESVEGDFGGAEAKRFRVWPSQRPPELVELGLGQAQGREGKGRGSSSAWPRLEGAAGRTGRCRSDSRSTDTAPLSQWRRTFRARASAQTSTKTRRRKIGVQERETPLAPSVCFVPCDACVRQDLRRFAAHNMKLEEHKLDAIVLG